MDTGEAYRVLEVCMDQMLRELTIESRFLVAEGHASFLRSGRGAFYADIPFKTLTSREQLAHLVYMPEAIVNSMEYSPVTEMLRLYNPASECVVLARVGIVENAPGEWDAYLKSQVMSRDACLTVSSSVEHVESRLRCNPNSEIRKPCSMCSTRYAPKLLKRCGRCHSASYCSLDCQRADWPNHKQFCVMMRGAKESLVELFSKKK